MLEEFARSASDTRICHHSYVSVDQAQSAEFVVLSNCALLGLVVSIRHSQKYGKKAREITPIPLKVQSGIWAFKFYL
jgi:hypothetical protein